MLVAPETAKTVKSFTLNIMPITVMKSIFYKGVWQRLRAKGMVFNNLRRKCRENLTPFASGKSLFCNILPVKYLESIFCRQNWAARLPKYNEMNILRAATSKKSIDRVY
jgi:hypothetical protein